MLVISFTAFFSIFIVKEVNQAIVLQFGDPKKIILKPGINFKLPFRITMQTEAGFHDSLWSSHFLKEITDDAPINSIKAPSAIQEKTRDVDATVVATFPDGRELVSDVASTAKSASTPHGLFHRALAPGDDSRVGIPHARPSGIED